MANHGMQPNAAYRLEPDSQSFSITAAEVREPHRHIYSSNALVPVVAAAMRLQSLL
jgi:hypothetical protein